MEMQKPKGSRVGGRVGEGSEGLKLGGEFNKPWLGEGLWLRTEVSEWGRGKMWARATAELLVTVLKL